MKTKLESYDIVIVWAGIAGCCVTRELARYNATISVLESGIDIADMSTRANSGIVHAGYDPKPGTLKAKYNVWGARNYPQWASDLGFQYEQNGVFVVGFNDNDLVTIEKLYNRGLENGVEKLQILSDDEARKIEPNLNPEIIGALYVPTSGICDPYQVAYRSAENAANNGVEFVLDCAVQTVTKLEDRRFKIKTVPEMKLRLMF